MTEFQEKNSKIAKLIQADYQHNVFRFKLKKQSFICLQVINSLQIFSKRINKIFEFFLAKPFILENLIGGCMCLWQYWKQIPFGNKNYLGATRRIPDHNNDVLRCFQFEKKTKS